jgi:hypothetical protein
MDAMRGTTQRGFAAMLTVLAVCAAGVQAQKLQSFSYPEDGFKASFPAEPQLVKKSQAGKTGSIELHSYCSLAGDASFCVVVISNGVEATGLAPEMMVQLVKQGVLTSPGTHKVSDTPVDLDGHTGVALEAASDATHTSTRIYAVGETVYQTIVTTALPASKAEKPVDAARFFGSFKLIGRKGN